MSKVILSGLTPAVCVYVCVLPVLPLLLLPLRLAAAVPAFCLLISSKQRRALKQCYITHEEKLLFPLRQKTKKKTQSAYRRRLLGEVHRSCSGLFQKGGKKTLVTV